MKKIMSTFMLLLMISSNFFYYSFAEEGIINAEEVLINNENVYTEESEEFEEVIEDTEKDTEKGTEKETEEVEEIEEVEEVVREAQEESQGTFTEAKSISENSTSCDDCEELCNDDEECILSCRENCEDDDWINDRWDLEDDDEWNEDDENSLPNLIISEVFFGGNNERIEVYNAWDDFEWDLVFSWIYNWKWTRNFFDVEIEHWWTKIFGNSGASNVLWNIEFLVPNSKFQIWDSSSFIIQLNFSWENLDTFSANAAGTTNNTSFHRIIETNEILATTTWYSQNVTSEYLANPWYVFLQEIEPEIPEEPELTWDIVEAPNLKITEIYFDWDDNRFEITNLWNSDFSWELTLNWNLNFTIPTQIPAWISKVFANSLATFQSGNNIEIISNNISFANEEINLNLIRSWEILDTFFVHESRVDYLQDWETSFEKVWKWNSWTTTYVGLNTDRIFNTNRWISANPTTYFTQWENMKDVTKDRNWTEIYTWNNYELPIDCDDFDTDYIIDISEIYYWNETYPSYVELKINDKVSSYFDDIILSWSVLQTPISFRARQMKANTFFLVTSSAVWYNEWRESKYDSQFSLNDSGFLIIYGDDWSSDLEVLDIVYVSEFSQWNSVYMWTESLECAWVFDYVDKFSPWLTIWQSQFIQITPDPIIQYVQVWWWGWSCPNNEQQMFDNTSSLTSEMQISAIKYYWNYQILKLKNKTNSDINLRDYYLQFLDWSTKNVQWNTLFAKSTMSFVWNYWLPTNQDFCVNLMKDGEVIDRYCRNSLTKATAQDEENIWNQLTFREDLYSEEEWESEEWEEQENPNNTWNSLQTNTIKIINIDYDPAWADWDNESVTLLLLTWTQVDLSDYKFYYTKDGKTQKAKAQIQWILSYWNRQTFKWWFAFPNSTDDKKSVTVNLIWPNGKVVDTYIYNPNKITEIPAGDYEIISVIDGDTAKINYDWQEITIRFAGIDAPESSALRCGKVECFWPEAKQYLKTLIEWKTVYFEPASMDWYDRFVWYISLNWENINEKMIKNWYAREYSYKNQSYKYQSKFKSAQNYAQNNGLWLRWYECKWERLCPVEETQAEYDFVFNIENIIYDPEWSDNWNEEIWIKMVEWIPMEFGTDFYLLVNDTKKSLKKYGSISPLETKKLVWTFWFPNNKLTTVSLVYNWEILDTYIYNPELDKLVDTGSTLSTWDELLAQISQFQILSILPNPFWADWSNEEIELFCKSDLQNLDLSSWFYLQIWTTKKYLKWEISTNESVNLKWAFSFPNKWWCVELGYKWFIFDKFCYTQPDEWQKFYVSNWVIESISTLDLSILKNSKLQNVWNKVCLTYAGQKFACKNMPYSKLSAKRISQNKLYKNFFDDFEWYLKDNWKIMYYDSEIKNYFELLDEIEDVISNWWSTIVLEWVTYDISQFHEMYEAMYKKTPSKTFSEVLKSLISDEIVNKYESLKSEYLEMLMNK